MSTPGQEFVEVFLQEASEHLQFLREYGGILLDAYPAQEDLERLYVAAHTLKGSSAMYGFPLFSEIAAKLTHIFQYAMNVGIGADAAMPLVEFISEAVALLESDLWFISTNSGEAADDVTAFKARYPFAFQSAQPVSQEHGTSQPAVSPAEELEEQQVESTPAPAPPVVSPSIAELRRPKPQVPTAPERPSAPTTGIKSETEPGAPLVTEKTTIAVPSEAKLISVATPVPSEVEVKPEPVLKQDPISEEKAVVPPTEPGVSVTSASAPAPAPEPLVQKPAVEPQPVIPEPARSVSAAPAAKPLAPVVPEPQPVAQAPAPAKAVAAPEPEIELPPDGDLPAEILEFFIPEVEEHLQTATECLLALEASANENDIHRLFRSMHTIKGSAAQVGLPRIALVAHRAEDLIGRLRDGALAPSADIIDLCLDSVDTLKKFLYRQWPDEATARRSTSNLLSRIARLAPEEKEEESEPAAEQPQALITEPGAILAGSGEPPASEVDSIAVSAAETVEANPLSDLLREQQADEPLVHPAITEASAAIPPLPADAEPLPLGDIDSVLAIPEPISEPLAELVKAREVVPPVAAVEAKPLPVHEPAPVPQQQAAPLPKLAQPAPVLAQPTPAKVEPPAPPKVEHVAAAKNETSPQRKPEPQEANSEPDSALAKVEAEIQPLLSLKKDPAAVAQSRSVRIALERLDRMMNAVGELVINRTRMLGRLAELERLADVLNFSKARMSDKISEFQEKYEFSRITGRTVSEPAPRAQGWDPPEAFPFRGGYSSYSQKFDASLAEFSELEMDRYDEFSILSRSLTEISADITEILTQLDGFVRRVDSDIDEFTKLAHRLQDEITAARMVPIGNLYTRISRTVRDAAKAAGKQIELQLAGAETELDNNIIQQIADPLLHLVRNSVAHGIERADERYEQGKADHGNVYVRAYHRGNHIYIEVEDDGRGLDYEKIRATAIDLGMVATDEAGRLTERDLQGLLFEPGFSTAPKKTELAGRGVGLDVVKANIAALNGEVEIESQKGLGTRFTLKVPLTLIISQALFVRCGNATFAFPLAFVEEIRRIRESDIEEVGGKLLTKVRDAVTEVVRLDMQLGLPPVEPLNGFYRLVIVNVAGRQVGIIVEEVLRKDEIVIKNLGEYLRNVKLFPGATIAPDGSLILLIDVNRLIAGEAIERRPLMTAANAARLFFPGATALASGEVPEEAIETVPVEKVVVLADDSISVRKFVGRMLEKAGYRVRLACDGLEALEIVSQTRCDLVVTDLEMPRTNGYELMAHLRQNPDTKDIPIMVVTSRAGMKHRDKAMKQGAIEFLVKPVQEEQFVAVVQRLIGPAGVPAAASIREPRPAALQLQGRG
jgi:chemosensory pili system protein ChpA (sensor histidine kinase/response regulator)